MAVVPLSGISPDFDAPVPASFLGRTAYSICG